MCVCDRKLVATRFYDRDRQSVDWRYLDRSRRDQALDFGWCDASERLKGWLSMHRWKSARDDFIWSGAQSGLDFGFDLLDFVGKKVAETRGQSGCVETNVPRSA